MTDPRNTGRRPNVHVHLSRWVKTGFAAELKAAIERVENGGEDEIFALYMPPEHQRAWTTLTHERVSLEELKKCKAAVDDNPVEWTIRMDNVERTLIASQENEAGTCPPRCT